MKEHLSLLKLGSSTQYFPLYCQYLNSDGHFLRTCNNEVYVEIEHESDIVGNINIFVLDNTLRSLETPSMHQDKSGEFDKLVIKEGKFKTELIMDDVEFPNKIKPILKTFDITNEIYTKIKTALSFTGSDIYSYAIIYKNEIIATNGRNVYYADIDIDVDVFLPINKKIFSMLSTDSSIGISSNTEDENNVIVKFNGGYVLFTTAIMDQYPFDRIAEFVAKTSEKNKLHSLCNIMPVKDQILKLKPIMFGEDSSNIVYYNSKNSNENMIVTAISEFNGKSTLEIETKCDFKFEKTIDINSFNSIPIAFDLYVSEIENHFVLQNNNELIIITA